MNYRSINDLNHAIYKKIPSLPANIDLIVGVPRSGMMPAAILSLYMHLPLTDVNGLIDGRTFKGGERTNSFGEAGRFKYKKVLVVEDSVSTGKSITEVKRQIKEAGLAIEILYAAIFVAPGKEELVDISFELVDVPRVFEWNMFHSSLLEYCCVDIDGVLCRDPSDDENDDGKKYVDFLETVPASIIPKVMIGHLVTSRLEKYRKHTENWLARNNIKYKELHMMSYQTAQERRHANAYSDFKAMAYKDTWSSLFIESDFNTSVMISRKTGKPVFCVDQRRMIYPGEERSEGITAALEAGQWRMQYSVKKIKRKITEIVWSILKWVK